MIKSRSKGFIHFFPPPSFFPLPPLDIGVALGEQFDWAVQNIDGSFLPLSLLCFGGPVGDAGDINGNKMFFFFFFFPVLCRFRLIQCVFCGSAPIMDKGNAVS